MKVRDRLIGPEHPPLVIAEIGINDGGDLQVAKSMITLAASACAECVKHQTHFVDDEMTEEAKSISPPNADVSIWEVMERCSLSAEDEISLKAHAENLAVIYISTPFSRKAADFLEEIDVPAFKLRSGEADNLPLIRHIARFDKPVIMSIGVQSVSSIMRLVQILRDNGVRFALLECTNLYPSPPEMVSLRGVTELQQAFSDAVVGFSDHSIGPEMALSSVALGASILERHFTASRYRAGPDISCSMDTAELRHLAGRSREVHIASRNSKGRSAAEVAVHGFAYGSIVEVCNLQAA